jgi:quinolinate synthase
VQLGPTWPPSNRWRRPGRSWASAAGTKIVPITYVNSAASVKAFVGRHDGACCTSFERSPGARMGVEPRRERSCSCPTSTWGATLHTRWGTPWIQWRCMTRCGQRRPDRSQIRKARFLLWKGHCSVHALFTESNASTSGRATRSARSSSTLSVAGKWCRRRTWRAAPSTSSRCWRQLRKVRVGRWTERFHLVNRLARKYAGRKSTVHWRACNACARPCTASDLPHLAWCLDELAVGHVVNPIKDESRDAPLGARGAPGMLENVPPAHGPSRIDPAVKTSSLPSAPWQPLP